MTTTLQDDKSQDEGRNVLQHSHYAHDSWFTIATPTAMPWHAMPWRGEQDLNHLAQTNPQEHGQDAGRLQEDFSLPWAHDR
jgi:hypothetical protein